MEATEQTPEDLKKQQQLEKQMLQQNDEEAQAEEEHDLTLLEFFISKSEYKLHNHLKAENKTIDTKGLNNIDDILVQHYKKEGKELPADIKEYITLLKGIRDPNPMIHKGPVSVTIAFLALAIFAYFSPALPFATAILITSAIGVLAGATVSTVKGLPNTWHNELSNREVTESASTDNQYTNDRALTILGTLIQAIKLDGKLPIDARRHLMPSGSRFQFQGALEEESALKDDNEQAAEILSVLTDELNVIAKETRTQITPTSSAKSTLSESLKSNNLAAQTNGAKKPESQTSKSPERKGLARPDRHSKPGQS